MALHDLNAGELVKITAADGTVAEGFVEQVGGVESEPTHRSDLEAQLHAVHLLAEKVQDRLGYLDEVQSDDFDEGEYKAYRLLEIIDDKDKSRVERAKLIADFVAAN